MKSLFPKNKHNLAFYVSLNIKKRLTVRNWVHLRYNTFDSPISWVCASCLIKMEKNCEKWF